MNATLTGTKRKLQHTTNSNGDTVIINKRFKLTIKEPIRTENLILNNNFPPALFPSPTPATSSSSSSTSSTTSTSSVLSRSSSSATDSPAILPTTSISASPGSSAVSSIASTPGIRSHLDVGLELCILEPEGMDSISRKHRSSSSFSSSSSSLGAGSSINNAGGLLSSPLAASSLGSSSSSSGSSHKKGHSIAVDKGRRLSHELRECRARLTELKNSPEWVSFQPSIRHFIQTDQNMSRYPAVIRRILDLPTIEKYLDDGVYATARDFDADVILMLDNAITYHTKMNTPYKPTIVPNAQTLKKNYLPYERWTVLHNRTGGFAAAAAATNNASSSSSHRSGAGDDDASRQVSSPTSSSSSSHKKKQKAKDSRDSAKIDKIEKMLQGLGETMNDIKKRPSRQQSSSSSSSSSLSAATSAASPTAAAASPRISVGTSGGASAAAASGLSRSSSAAGIAKSGGGGGFGKRNPTAANYKSPNGVKYGSFTRFKSTIDCLPRQRHIKLLSKAFQLAVSPVFVDKDMVRHTASTVDIDFELLSETIIKSIHHEANDIIKQDRTARQKEDQFLPSQPRVGPPAAHLAPPRMQPHFPRAPGAGPLTPRSPHSPMGPPLQHTPPAPLPPGAHMLAHRGPLARPPQGPHMPAPAAPPPLQRVTTYPFKAPAPPSPQGGKGGQESDSDSGSSSGSDSETGTSDGSSSSSPESPQTNAAGSTPAAGMTAAGSARVPLAKMPQLPPHLAGAAGRMARSNSQGGGGGTPVPPQVLNRMSPKMQGSGSGSPVGAPQ